MVPLELDGKTPWPMHKSRIALQQISDAALSRFVVRDESFGIVKGSCLVFAKKGSDGPTTGFVDPLKASVKHSGQEHTDATISDWWEFCQEPKASSDVDAPRMAKPKPVDPRTVYGFNPHPTIVSTLVASQDGSGLGVKVNTEPEKKKRGRPRLDRYEGAAEVVSV